MVFIWYRLIPKICEWAKYQNRHSSKSMSYETVLLPNWSSHQGRNLAKKQFHNSYTFWAMPILIFSRVQIIMTHPLCTFLFSESRIHKDLFLSFIIVYSLPKFLYQLQFCKCLLTAQIKCTVQSRFSDRKVSLNWGVSLNKKYMKIHIGYQKLPKSL